MELDTEKLSRYIEVLKIREAEAIQKCEELKRLFAELYETAWWYQDWIRCNAINKIVIYRNKFDDLNRKWEFHKE